MDESINFNTKGERFNTSKMTLCRICLSRGGKLYSMSKCGLNSPFQLLTGLSIDEDKDLPQWVCAECGLRLMSYNKLRQKSLRSHQTLCDLLTRYDCKIEDINVSPEIIESRLSRSGIVISHYDPSQEGSVLLTNDIPILTEFKLEDLNETEQIENQTNADDLSPFNNADDLTSNDEEISLSKLLETKKHKIKISRKTRNNKNNEQNYSKQKEKGKKSSQKHGVKKSSTNCRQSNPNTINHEKNETESQKRLKKTAESSGSHREKEPETIDHQSHPKTINHEINESESRKRKRLKKTEESSGNHKKKDPETNEHKQNESQSQKRFKKTEQNQNKDGRLKKFPFESMFTVNNMTMEELKAEVLKREMSSNYMNAAFQCTDCFKGFCDQETYDRHTLRHSQEWGSVICDICKNHYPCKRSLARHISRMHTLRYTCKNCSFVASSRGSALRHGLKHMGKKYQCKHCEMEYVNYTTYLNHVRKSHASEFICELCGLSFVSALGVVHHKKIIHRLEAANMVLEGPHCTACDIRFATEAAYAKHFKYSAKHVVKAYDVKQKRLNQGIKQPTFCEQCDLKLDSQSAYFKHFKSAHPDKKRTRVQYSYSFMCEECGRIFKSNIALVEHRRIHSKEKPYPCTQCGRAFTQKIALKMHATTHDEHRTLYPCHLCEKRFTNRNNLKRHIFLHSGIRPFECESCGKSFKSKNEKQTHYEYVHLKKPWPKRDRHRRVIASASGTNVLQ